MFQSLFLWIFRSYSGKKLHSRRAWRVSILVLMDLSFLRHVNRYASINSILSFNPCSYGSFVLTLKHTFDHIKETLKFQSLFLWIFRSYFAKGQLLVLIAH